VLVRGVFARHECAARQFRHGKSIVLRLSRETLGYFLGFIGVVIFGGTLPATRAAVADLAPWFVTMGRAAIAGVLAVVVLVALRRPLPPRELWGDIVIASACLVIAFPGFIGLAMQTVPASQGGVVLGILPLATALCGALFAGDRPPAAFWGWSLAGAALVLAFTLKDSGIGQAGFTLAIGNIYLLGAVAATGIGYAFSARVSRRMPGWETISWACLVALPFTLPLAWWLRPADFGAVGGSAWSGFAYTAVMSQYVGFFAWNAGLAMGGVAKVSQVQLLQQFVTLGISAVFLGERIEPVTWCWRAAHPPADDTESSLALSLDPRGPERLRNGGQSAGRPPGETLEESPGSMETRRRLTAAGGDPRDSATETYRLRKTPRSSREVRVKRCGKSAPRPRQRGWQGKPRREQNRIGTARRPQGRQAWLQAAVRVGCMRWRASVIPDEWPPRRGNPALQNPAYRPTDAFSLALRAVPRNGSDAPCASPAAVPQSFCLDHL
jgi:drug/metabolite transporter (DMT)-like permease